MIGESYKRVLDDSVTRLGEQAMTACAGEPGSFRQYMKQ